MSNKHKDIVKAMWVFRPKKGIQWPIVLMGIIIIFYRFLQFLQIWLDVESEAVEESCLWFLQEETYDLPVNSSAPFGRSANNIAFSFKGESETVNVELCEWRSLTRKSPFGTWKICQQHCSLVQRWDSEWEKDLEWKQKSCDNNHK